MGRHASAARRGVISCTVAGGGRWVATITVITAIAIITRVATVAVATAATAALPLRVSAAPLRPRGTAVARVARIVARRRRTRRTAALIRQGRPSQLRLRDRAGRECGSVSGVQLCRLGAAFFERRVQLALSVIAQTLLCIVHLNQRSTAFAHSHALTNEHTMSSKKNNENDVADRFADSARLFVL